MFSSVQRIYRKPSSSLCFLNASSKLELLTSKFLPSLTMRQRPYSLFKLSFLLMMVCTSLILKFWGIKNLLMKGNKSQTIMIGFTYFGLLRSSNVLHLRSFSTTMGNLVEYFSLASSLHCTRFSKVYYLLNRNFSFGSMVKLLCLGY